MIEGLTRGAHRAIDVLLRSLRYFQKALFGHRGDQFELAIGLRFHPVGRLKLHREIHEVETRWGKVRVKTSSANGGAPTTISPEYDDCRRIATEHKVALRVVMEEARDAARSRAGHQ